MAKGEVCKTFMLRFESARRLQMPNCRNFYSAGLEPTGVTPSFWYVLIVILASAGLVIARPVS